MNPHRAQRQCRSGNATCPSFETPIRALAAECRPLGSPAVVLASQRHATPPKFRPRQIQNHHLGASPPIATPRFFDPCLSSCAIPPHNVLSSSPPARRARCTLDSQPACRTSVEILTRLHRARYRLSLIKGSRHKQPSQLSC